MSQLLKALKSLETRGAVFAPPPPDEAILPSEQALEHPAAGIRNEQPARVKPRLTQRVRPRRASVPQATPVTARPLMEKLPDVSPLPVGKGPLAEPIPPPRKPAPPTAQQYTLAPAMLVNQSALEAGAALARELAVEEVASVQWTDEQYPAEPRRREMSAPQRASVFPPAAAIPARSITLFEHRIHETLMHPARSRPFAELVERLRQDFRGSQKRSLLFTDIGPASRGDEMLAHVAALCAEQGTKVLLIDGDFARAGLTAGFEAGTLGGLQNALAAPRTWRDHVLPTSLANLSLLPAGRGNLNIESAAATLTSFLPQLETEFPLVLIDGGQSNGPLLLPLARACDATYFVIRLGSTDAKEAQLALKNYRSAGARVMGCVAVMANDG
jgi:Mrp family chromosome partitioning ATPase